MALQPHPSTTIQVEESEDGYDCCCCFDNPKFKKLLKGLFYGQVLSLCLCGTGIGSQKLSEYKVNTPMAQSFLNYFFLAFVYGIALLFRNGSESIYDILRKRGLKYVLLAVIDVEANYLVVWSYQYTNLTSVQLLDCATIPFVMILSFFMLRVRYLTIHIIGVAFCLIGICFVIWSDAIQSSGPSTDAPNKYLGDFLCIASSALYACSNTGEEKLIKQHSRSEYLGLVGIFGSIIAGLQLALFEREKLEEVKWDWTVISW
uniref:Solute carrier family 35 member F1 n=1 Tax=Rhabditophanes sp. KR3021 TaxID=114890 RepID=A0AC35U9S1_9BILA